VAEKIEEIGKKSPGSVVILDVPLLIEAGMDKGLEDVILVYTPEDIQINRLVERDKISRDAALLKILSQMPIEKKKEFAKIIIDNSGTLQATRERTLEVFNYLKNKGV
jgi:dephospho-CoA kinase